MRPSSTHNQNVEFSTNHSQRATVTLLGSPSWFSRTAPRISKRRGMSSLMAFLIIGSTASLPCLTEISQVRRRLVLSRRHQVAVSAHEIVLLADHDVVVVLGAIVLEPRHVAVATIALVHRPGMGEG